ncbi:MAG: hypothetical protein Q8N26_14730 [Myxococcales bacterium]|nr:hypothetical protein [Myxococcales bacterium]
MSIEVPAAPMLGLVWLGALSACAAPTVPTTLTWFSDAKPIIDTRCGSCHRPPMPR